VPSSRDVLTMFHRRLLLLLAAFGVALLAITVQVGRLTLARGDESLAQAESRLESLQWVRTTRGRILDRKGRVLAQDRPSFDAAVEYEVLSGAWAERQAGRQARAINPRAWAQGGPEQRAELIERYLPIFTAHVERGWRLMAQAAGIGADELSRRRDAVTARVERTEAGVRRARRAREYDAVLARGRELTTEVEEEIARRVRTPIREARSPHVVLAGVGDAVGFALMGLADRTETLSLPGPDGPVEVEAPLVPGLTVKDSAGREYPYETVDMDVDRSTFPSPLRTGEDGSSHARVRVAGVATNVIGWVGAGARAEDVQARRERLAADPALWAASRIEVAGVEEDRGGYEDGDPVGRWGAEAGREDQLHGLRGLRVERLDTGQERVVPAVPGRDVALTIDVALQARIQALMDPSLGLARVQPWHTASDQEHEPTMPVGTPLSGAVVVLDVASGEILAMVSTPSFTREDVRDRPESVFNDAVSLPYLDRTISRPYPPGSIAKAALLCAAVTLGRHSLDDRIECAGHLNPHQPDALRCWVYKRFHTTHSAQLGGPLDARQALMVSCNIYFFTLGRRLGADGIGAAYGMFHVGRAFDLGIAPGREEAGAVGRLGPVADGRRTVRPPTADEAIQMGIGQGPVVWTPLHAADAYATIARRGVEVRPRVIADGSPPERHDLGLDQRAVAAALAGLDDVVNNVGAGTGNSLTIEGRKEPIFNTPGVHVWGKTGTAAAPPIVLDPGGPDRRTVRDGDHSWFVILAGPTGGDPRYAIAVLMEYAGSGGKVSGPIANQVVHALIAEGYL
jgi:penicillin-binding protein 2